MKKTTLNALLGIMLSLGTTFSLSAQETKIFAGFGGIYNSYQDARFTNYIHSTISVKPELGFQRLSDKDFWNINLSGYSLKTSIDEFDTTSTLGYNLRVGYLRNIKNDFFLGVHWDIIDYWKKQTIPLENGADAYKLSSDISVSAFYKKELTEDWRIDFRLDYGLISFINSAPSFSANFQQNTIDNGEVIFNDSEIRSPFKLRNMTTKGFWNQINMRTVIGLNYKTRWALNYIWEVRSYSDVKDYPITNGMHSLMLRYNFVYRSKAN